MLFLVVRRKQMLCLLFATIILFVGICVYANTNPSKSNPEEIPVPILMYHSILKDQSRSGKYVITPQTLEKDLLYLKENGYHTILVSDLIDYVYHNGTLPCKPVILTFDDGYYNNMTYLLPLLTTYDMKAVISVVGSYTEEFSKIDSHNPNYSYLTWEDIQELEYSGRIEIANHTYQMHESAQRNGCSIKKGESPEEYQKILSQDLVQLQDELTRKSKIKAPLTFTYPFGYICKESQNAVEEAGFLASLSCYETISKISKEPSSLYCLGRFNRPSGIATEKFMKKIQIP